ncbi:MAG: CaiB/BaiF CoA transferase family protein [Streptosporangiaceae bacterium]
MSLAEGQTHEQGAREPVRPGVARAAGDSGQPDDPPLAGVRVVDLSTSYAGPTATMYLADMGAEVIKVERPGDGDDARSWGPPFVGSDSAWFHSANRGKRSIAINLRSVGGQRVLGRMLERADVFVENLNPAKLESLGLDPEAVRRRYPRVIYCAISGFGLTGPDSELAGYDLVAQARSGLMSVTGQRGGAPQRVSTALSDIVTGLVAAFAVTAALRRQERTGEGEVVDASLFDADLALMAPRIASYLAGEPEPRPSGGTDSVLAVYQPFETVDRPIVVAIGNDAIWRRFCSAVGVAELAADPELADNAGRRAARARIIPRVAERLRSRTASQWLRTLADAAVPAAPIQTLSEVVADPQVGARRVIRDLPGADGARPRVVASPWRFAGANGGARSSVGSSAEAVGADTVDILRAHGFSADAIDGLLASGAVAGANREEDGPR